MKKTEKALECKKWAVLGASENTSKYGYKIFKRLMELGKDVVPINPNYDSVEGFACFDGLNAATKEHEIEVLSVVVGPKYSMELLENQDLRDVKYLWFQSGTFNDEVIAKANELCENVIDDACVLVESRR